MIFSEYVQETIDDLKKLQNDKFESLFRACGDLILKSILDGGPILICGNGGSHADAQHFSGELINYFTKPHKALPVLTLGTNSAVSSAWSNDHAFEDQFAREVEAFGTLNSVLIGITTSGKSKNILRAFAKAQKMGIPTIALTSSKAVSELSNLCELILPIPAAVTHKIQESHIVVYHALCLYIENLLPDRLL